MPVINRCGIKAITSPYATLFFVEQARTLYLLIFFNIKIIVYRPCHCIFAMQIRANSIHASLSDGRLHHLGNLAIPNILYEAKSDGTALLPQILGC